MYIIIIVIRSGGDLIVIISFHFILPVKKVFVFFIRVTLGMAGEIRKWITIIKWMPWTEHKLTGYRMWSTTRANLYAVKHQIPTFYSASCSSPFSCRPRYSCLKEKLSFCWAWYKVGSLQSSQKGFGKKPAEGFYFIIQNPQVIV